MTDFTKIKVGERLSTTMYMEVISKDKDSIEVKDNLGRQFVIQGKTFIQDNLESNTQFTKTEKVTKTKLAELLTSAGDSIFKVVFEKQTGDHRELTGRLLGVEGLLGRSKVVDLELSINDPAASMRQVDHRTIQELVLKGTKYVLK